MSQPPTEHDLFGSVLFQQALQHPLPWRIESDWTEEVIASDGYCIAKCETPEEAEAIIRAAVASWSAPADSGQA